MSSRFGLAAGLAMLAMSRAGSLVAQQPPPGVASGVTGRELFALDLSGTQVGDFPSSLSLLKGDLTVATRDGLRMLKASTPSEFLITLSEILPQDFTIQFDLVPKLGSNPQDLSFEGTRTINQGDASAHVLWHATGYLSVIGGGGDTYESPMPEALRTTLPGVRTKVVAEVQGERIKLYTNGRLLFALQKQFARGRVLRVFLGGTDDGLNAVYLAGLRIAGGSPQSEIAGGPGAERQTGQQSQAVTVGSVSVPGSGGIQAVGGGTGPATVATSAPATPPVLGGRSPGTSAAPIGNGNPAGAASAALFAPPPPRTISLSGFTGAGTLIRAASRTIALPGFAGTREVTPLTARTVRLPGIAGTRVVELPALRTIVLSGFAGVGPVRVVNRAGPAVSGLPGTESSTPPVSRSITLSGITGTRISTTPGTRTITLAGIAGMGVPPVPPASRTLPLVEIAAAGVLQRAASRVITLPGSAGSGIPKTP